MAKRKDKNTVKCEITPSEYRESALACAQMAQWSALYWHEAPTAEGMRKMYRIAWENARDFAEMERFIDELESADSENEEESDD